MTGKHHRAWYLCGFKLHSLVVRDVEAYGLTCYFYIIFGKYMFMSSCFLIAFLISIIKCTQPNLPLILFVCGMSVYVRICQPQMRKSEDNHGYGSLPSGLLEAASLVSSLQAPGYNFWGFSYLHLSSLWRDTGIRDMGYYIQLLHGLWASKLRLVRKFFFSFTHRAISTTPVLMVLKCLVKEPCVFPRSHTDFQNILILQN